MILLLLIILAVCLNTYYVCKFILNQQPKGKVYTESLNFPIRLVDRYYRRSDLQIIHYVVIEDTVYTYPLSNLFKRVQTWRRLPQEFNSWQSAYEFVQRAVKASPLPADNVIKIIYDPLSLVDIGGAKGGD